MADEKGHGLGPEEGSIAKTTERPYDDLINDPEMEGLTVYEKKALLVDRELNSHGMGKYQVMCPGSAASEHMD